jgi:hypothetical protein
MDDLSDYAYSERLSIVGFDGSYDRVSVAAFDEMEDPHAHLRDYAMSDGRRIISRCSLGVSRLGGYTFSVEEHMPMEEKIEEREEEEESSDEEEPVPVQSRRHRTHQDPVHLSATEMKKVWKKIKKQGKKVRKMAHENTPVVWARSGDEEAVEEQAS